VAYYVPGSDFKNRVPSIVIEPEWENILNSIIISFVMIEKMKRDRQAGAVVDTIATIPS
jgi:hypothetical protein